MNIYRAFVLSVILVAPAEANCGFDAYRDKISQTKAADAKLQEELAQMHPGDGRQAVIVGGSVVSARDLGEALSALSDLGAIDDAGKIMHYQEVLENINQAETLSSKEMAGLNDKNGALFHTTHLINAYYKNPAHTYTMREVAGAIKSAIRSGALCRPDGELAVTGDFRDVVAKNLKK